MKKKKIAIFISEVGYGHLSRQKIIIDALLKKTNYEITIFNQKFLNVLKKRYKNKLVYKNFSNKFKIKSNNLGSFDYSKTLSQLKIWKKNYLKNKSFDDFKNFDLIITDLVLEATTFGKIFKIPVFGICHFTWSWFLKKTRFPKSLFKDIEKKENMVTKFFFPPLTPMQCKRVINYKKKIEIDFISKKLKRDSNRKYKTFLIMDNGTKSLKKKINGIIPFLSKIKDCKFYIDYSSLSNKSKKIVNKNSNLKFAFGENGMEKYLTKVNHVICRAGFNSITEILVNNKTSLLTGQKNNIEVHHNLDEILKKKLASKIDENDWGKNIIKRINYFLKFEDKKIKKNLSKHKFSFNGADQVVKNIINYLNK